MKYTPENITKLESNQVFVAATNLSGIHGAGSAKLAYQKFGLKWGFTSGLCGQVYAIPTKDRKIQFLLPISEIEKSVNKFLVCVQNNPNLEFLITRIGMGLANGKIEDIAPLFKDFINLPNVSIPKDFYDFIISIGPKYS
jgi:hypothetical protein